MKKFPLPALFPVLLLSAACAFLAGCNSLDNPLGGLLSTGHDARVYNSQTGQWEWPKDEKKRQAQARKSGVVSSALATTSPAPERQGDGRYYDSQKGQWVEVREERSTSGAAKNKKPSTAPIALTTTLKPVGTPPPERPPRASGIYNPHTGQIEWTDFNPAPRAKPTPSPKEKKWYWPF